MKISHIFKKKYLEFSLPSDFFFHSVYARRLQRDSHRETYTQCKIMYGNWSISFLFCLLDIMVVSLISPQAEGTCSAGISKHL